MTREEAITRWIGIAKTVFIADGKIADQWRPRLTEARSIMDKQPEEAEKVANDYLRAVAEEIVDKTSDAELAEMV